MTKRRFMSHLEVSDEDTTEWITEVAVLVARGEYGALFDDSTKKGKVLDTCLDMAAIRPEAALKKAVSYLGKVGDSQRITDLTKRGKELQMVNENFNPIPAGLKFIWWVIIGLAIVGAWSLIG